MKIRSIAEFNFVCLFVSGLVLIARTTYGQVIIPGADGSDGAFNPSSTVDVRLDFAPIGTWDGPNPNPGLGLGVYDQSKWAIVFRYSSVNIPSGVTVRFINHPANPPVVWLVAGPVTINGTLTVSTQGALDPTGFQLGGPGGFRGPLGQNGVGGLGPGGGSPGQQSASYAVGLNSYGNSRVLPLIGGSGGPYYGAAAGGAILIAASGIVAVNGSITANGGAGSGVNNGSGGGIRLICDRLQGTGSLAATSTAGIVGRIRVEANQVSFASTGTPTASFGLPGATATLWPESAVAPSVRVVSMGPEAVPSDPRASFEFPYADVNLTNGSAQVLVIEAANVPTGSDPPGTPA